MARRYRSEFHRHKASDKVKWIVAFFLIFVLLAGMAIGGLELFGKDKLKPSNWGKTQEEKVDLGGGLEIADSETDAASPITLTAFSIPKEAFAAYNIAATADSAQVLKATVKPEEYGSNVTLVWEAEFDDPASEWAQGKHLDDYIALTFPDNAAQRNTCSVICVRPFGEQINIKCFPIEKPEASATVRADYRQRVTDFKMKLGEMQLSNGSNTGVELELGDEAAQGGMPNPVFETSDVYTLPYEMEITYQLEGISENLNENFYTFVQATQKGSSHASAVGFTAETEGTTQAAFDFSAYDVTAKGITFSLKFLHENMNLNCYDGTDGTDIGTLEDARNTIIGAWQRPSDYEKVEWHKALFKLTWSVHMTSDTQSDFEGWTVFEVKTYHYTSPVTGVEVTPGHIIF